MSGEALIAQNLGSEGFGACLVDSVPASRIDLIAEIRSDIRPRNQDVHSFFRAAPEGILQTLRENLITVALDRTAPGRRRNLLSANDVSRPESL